MKVLVLALVLVGCSAPETAVQDIQQWEKQELQPQDSGIACEGSVLCGLQCCNYHQCIYPNTFPGIPHCQE